MGRSYSQSYYTNSTLVDEIVKRIVNENCFQQLQESCRMQQSFSKQKSSVPIHFFPFFLSGVLHLHIQKKLVNGMANGAQVLSKQRIIPAVKVHHLKNLKSSEAVILTLELIYSICISFLKT
jgi:hypothetical protein